MINIKDYYDEKTSVLKLEGLGLKDIPQEVFNLKDIKALSLSRNEIVNIPHEIVHLSKLEDLLLDNNKIVELPDSICDLSFLQNIRLSNNPLRKLPECFGALRNLKYLEIANCHLQSLPNSIANCSALESLHLQNNRLHNVPIEFHKLGNINDLYLDNNPIKSPPNEIIKFGKSGIWEYLAEKANGCKESWSAKLVLVGEGGAGKTSLLNSLLDIEFNPLSPTTHGISIETLKVKNPLKDDIYIDLNVWDFGGQMIYHATHQFFLTDSSIFILVWNSRHGYEQGKIDYWLSTIQAKAPSSPVIIVASHIDERDAVIPINGIIARYNQVVGLYEISNKTNKGVSILREAIAQISLKLPRMGEAWPLSWLNVKNEISELKEKYISPNKLWEIMKKNKVSKKAYKLLAKWLHELGIILFFTEDENLQDFVIIKPQWVSDYINLVLVNEEVIERLGVLTRDQRDDLWQDIDPSTREHFLRLMEKFDLSYRTLENREISLVVERLPLDPPDFKKRWNNILETVGCKEISMEYKLNIIPPGIPTWFIARSHRFTTHTHWRYGALFTDHPDQKHLALVYVDNLSKSFTLHVRGPYPQNFFALLKDGLELTLNRYPGLEVEQLIPCLGHDGKACNHKFNYHHLLKRIERNEPIYLIECPEGLEHVDVRLLLFGLTPNSMEAVRAEILKASLRQNTKYDETEFDDHHFSDFTDRPNNLIYRIPYYYGSYINDPSKFFGRKKELNKVINLIHQSHYGDFWHVAIIGDYRIGKSSLLKNLEYRIPQETNSLPIFFDLSNETEDTFFNTLITKVGEAVFQESKDKVLIRKYKEAVFSKGSKIIKELGLEASFFGFLKVTMSPKDPLSWTNLFNGLKNLYNKLNEFGDYSSIVLIMDEISSVSKWSEHKNLLRKLRSLAQQLSGYSFVVGSAQPLYQISKDEWSPFFNIFKTIKIESLPDDEANLLITEPGKSVNVYYNYNAIEYIKGLTGNHPYYIQVLCSVICEKLIKSKDISLVNRELIAMSIPDVVSILNEHFMFFWNKFSDFQKDIIKQCEMSQKKVVKQKNLLDEQLQELNQLFERNILRLFNDEIELCGIIKNWVQKNILLEPLLVNIENEECRYIGRNSDIKASGSEEYLTLLQREFIKNQHAIQCSSESHCPSVFSIRPHQSKTFKKNPRICKLKIQLYCQNPGCWHPADTAFYYIVEDTEIFIKKMYPYIQILKENFLSPLSAKERCSLEQHEIQLIEEDILYLETFLKAFSPKLSTSQKNSEILNEHKIRTIFRFFRKFLNSAEGSNNWSGLRKVFTPEGHYLWLCEEHATEYLI